jgi:hypothetical protein
MSVNHLCFFFVLCHCHDYYSYLPTSCTHQEHGGLRLDHSRLVDPNAPHAHVVRAWRAHAEAASSGCRECQAGGRDGILVWSPKGVAEDLPDYRYARTARGYKPGYNLVVV